VTDGTRGDFDTALGTAPVTAVDAARSRIDAWWRRIPPRHRAAWRYGAWALILVVAAVSRLWNIGSPHALVFDETFYVKDAWTLVHLGYESTWPAEADAAFTAGETDIYSSSPSFVVHPPLGKWLIGLGMLAFGADNPVGWRIASALIGILAVALVMVVGKALFHSNLVAALAGGLMAIDGNAIVMSRVGLLDNFVMFFALLGFGAVLLDRRFAQDTMALWAAGKSPNDASLDWGPTFWWRPWLVAAGTAFGLTAAVKWSGLYFLAGFAVYTVIVDALARRRAGVAFWITGTIWRQAPVNFLLTVPTALAAYLAAWTGWFTTSGGYDRDWAGIPGNAWDGAFAWVPLELQSLWHFHSSVYAYHVGENSPHPYSANPLTWLFLIRPTAMYFRGSALGENGCSFDYCGESITGLANPLVWWAGAAAALYLAYRLVRLREWRVGLVLTGLAVGYLPWLFYLNRTVYHFYTIAFEPYLILGLAFTIVLVLGTPDDDSRTRSLAIRLVGAFLVLAVLLSVFFWPLWSGMQVEFGFLRAHWWLPTWR